MNCPNPTCNLQFSDYQGVCEHLTQPETPCLEWTCEFLNVMVQGIGWHDEEEKQEKEQEQDDQGMFL